MAEDIAPSSGGSVTPTPETPVTGTPANGSVTPPTAALTLEEALKRIADLEHSHRNAKDAEDRLGKKLSSYEKKEAAELAAKKAADEAQLSEVERVKKLSAEAEQRVQRYKQELVTSKVTLAAHAKGIIDPELAALAIQNSLEYDDDGMPTNVDKALDALIKSKPYLAPKPAETPATSPAATPGTPAVPATPAMNPGRTAILPPGSAPAQRLSMSEAYKLSAKKQ